MKLISAGSKLRIAGLLGGGTVNDLSDAKPRTEVASFCLGTLGELQKGDAASDWLRLLFESV